jgi:competence protein ComEC
MMGKERRRHSITYINRYVRSLSAQIQAGAWLWLSWPWWMSTGLILVPFLSSLWPMQWLLALGMFSGLWFLSRKMRALSSAAILFILGALWGTLWGQHTLNRALPEALIKQDVWASGTVRDLPRQQSRALRFKFNIESLEYNSRAYSYSGDVLLNWYKPFPELKPGQRWRLKLRLKPASGSLNPGGFNYAQWLFSQGIRATGYVREPKVAVLLEATSPAHRFDLLRGQIKQFIQAQGLEYGGLLNALAVGVRTGISERQWQVFRDTGTAHLVAISGLHIGMVAAIAYFLGQWLWRHSLLITTQYPAQKSARVLAVLAAASYAALAGFSLPTLRALLMLLAYFSLQSLRRNPGTLFSLGFVLLVVLVFDPLAPLGSGLWLSFSAVGTIALVVQGEQATGQGSVSERAELSYRGRLKQWFRQWWRVQLAVFLGLLPLTLFFFQQVSIVSLPANFIAIPVIASMVVPLVLLALSVLLLACQPCQHR